MQKKLLALLVIFSVLCISYVAGQGSKALSLHILDNTNGGDGPNATCRVYKMDSLNGEFVLVNEMLTDENGRADMIPGSNFTTGIYRIWVDTKEYFNARGMNTYWPEWQVTFYVENVEIDYHVPVTLSQFGLSTYRGS